MRPRTSFWGVTALVIMLIEVAATFGSVAGEPFSPVAGWASTRQADVLTFVVVVLGCVALTFFDRAPRAVATVSTASYLVFSLRDHELGMFLPAMIVIFALFARGGGRLVAVLCTVVSLGAAFWWVARRAGPIDDPGAMLLASVAFGAVHCVFFVAPILVGEIVRLRTLLRRAQSLTPVSRP